MQQHRRRLDQVLDPGFMEGLEKLGLDALRERRNVAVEVENELSYYRRLLYGRMDLIKYEQRRRAGEESRSLVDALVDILTDPTRTDGSGSRGQRHIVTDLPPLPDVGKREIDAVMADDVLLRTDDVADEELEASIDAYQSKVSEINEQRLIAQDVIDRLTDLITQRFQAESASSTEN